MTLFQLVRITLDQLYLEAQEAYGADADKKIKERLAYLSKSYTKLTDPDRDPVDYRDPATRFAYVYRYVAAHGDYIVQTLKSLRSDLESPVLPAGVARVSCIGGGLGSDIIAVLKYLNDIGKKESVNKIIVYLLDREQSWADTWTEIDDAITGNVQVNANFQPLDVTQPASWQSQKKFLQADLFTFSYFVSEVAALDGDGSVSACWQEIFAGAKSGALFLYIDNGSDTFNDYFDEAWKAGGLELVFETTNTSMTPSFSEQASELKSYMDKFGGWPKLKATVSVRVLRKP